MARLLILILLLLLFYLILHLLIRDMPSRRRNPGREIEAEELVQDPSCRTYTPKRSAIHKRIAGENLYFCSEACLKRYLDQKRESA